MFVTSLRPGILTGCLLIGIAPAAAAPVPTKGVAARPPTPEEVAAAKRAFAAIGGSFVVPIPRPDDPTPLPRCSLPQTATAETYGNVPDLPFDFNLVLQLHPGLTRDALTRLGRLRHLRQVEVIQMRIDPDRAADILAGLDRVPYLERLKLLVPAMNDRLADHLLQFQSLRWLSAVGVVSDSGIAKLAQHRSLERLSLGGNDKLTDAGVAQLARLDGLTHLSLGGFPNLTDAGIAPLAGMRGLRHLSLSECPKMTAAGLVPFAEKSRLVGLSLWGKKYKGDGFPGDLFATVGRITSLEKLDLGSFRPLAAEELTAVSRLPALKQLVLPYCRYAEEHLEAISAAAGLESVQIPTAGAVTDDGLKHLVRMPALKEVTLEDARNVTGAGLRALAAAPHLESLSLPGAKKIADADLKELAGMPKLTGLDVSGTRVTDAGLKAFVAGRPDLRTLKACSLKVTDALLTELAGKCPRLEQLNLEDCAEISDAGITAICRSGEVDGRLKVLYFSSKKITDASVPSLARLKTLRYLQLMQSGISRAGVRDLDEKLPACVVLGLR